MTGLVVLAMGKHGACELNYSSDIDLVVFYDEDKFPFQRGGDKRSAAVDLVKGDIVLDSKLAKEGAREGMAPLISKSKTDDKAWMQAATILTPTASAGVGGFIRPGDHVDVLVLGGESTDDLAAEEIQSRYLPGGSIAE